jgi:hypothetical protein
MTNTIDALGIIAGNRELPLILAREARRLGVRKLVAVAFEGETRPELGALVDEMVWLKVGQLSQLIAAFKDRGITRCVMAGQIAPKRLFDLRPDLRAARVLFRLKEKNAHTLFGAVAEELNREGVELISAMPWLHPILPSPGYVCGPRPTEALAADAQFGLRIAKAIAALEIGQTVVVKGGTVLAVEGFEGTDACLQRGGELAGSAGGAVAVKVSKENHDFRFDIPCVGPRTIEVCAGAGIRLLAFEGGKTLLLGREELERLSAHRRVGLIAVS